MNHSTAQAAHASLPVLWDSRGEATRNWIAFGLLLAAWNSVDDAVAGQSRERPDALRAYSHVSVRAARRNPVSDGGQWLAKFTEPSTYCHARCP